MQIVPLNFIQFIGANKTKKARRPKKRSLRRGKSLKKMNCSPAVKGKTANSNTCYTTDILMKIRNAYNAGHSINEKIASDDPAVVWNELNQRLAKCEKEDCWLTELKDANLRKEIDEYIFAPDQPPEWKKNKNEWLSNYDIEKVMRQYEKTYPDFLFVGPTPIDFATRLPEKGGKCVWQELCSLRLTDMVKRGKHKLGITFNLDKHNEPGSHWVSLFVDLKHNFIFYYDSAAGNTPREIVNLKKNLIDQGKRMHLALKFHKNIKAHQFGNTECGMYSLFFIITMLTSEVDGTSKLSLDEKMKLFKGGKIPDAYVEKYRNVYFNN